MRSGRWLPIGTWRFGSPKSEKGYSPDSIEAVWDAWRNDAPKDECRVQLEGLEKEWGAGTELGLLRAIQFPGLGTASVGSVGLK